MRGADSIVPRIFEFESRTPAWLRPTYRGAVFILGLSLGRVGKLLLLGILATLMLMAGPGPGVALFFQLLGVAVIAGAVGGTIHGVLRPLENWGRVGTWLRWALSIFGHVTAFGFLTPGGPLPMRDAMFYLGAAGFAAVGAGFLILLDDRRSGRPSPRSFRLLQNRERLWAAAERARARMQSRQAPDGGGSRHSGDRRID